MGISQRERNKLIKQFYVTYREDPPRFAALPGVTSAWDAMKMVRLYRMVVREPRPSHADMAEELGYERSTVTRKVNSVKWDRFEATLQELCSISYDEAICREAEEARNRQAAKSVVKVRRKEVSNRAFLAELEELISDTVAALPRQSLPKLSFKKNRRHSNEHMGLLLSDIHCGQEFSSMDTGGLGGYNEEVFKARAANLRQAVLDILSLHSEVRQIPVLHVMGLGDFVHGANLVGEWGPAYTSMDIAQQAITVAQVVAEMLDAWSAYFERVEFDGVIGNHGRAGAKSSEKVSANWDLVAYALLQAMLKDRPNINVNYSQAWWSSKNINDWEFLMVHGDYISNSLNSIKKEELKLQNLVSRSTQRAFDFLCMGHIHTYGDLQTSRGGILINGCWTGGDVYSMQQLREGGRPTQFAFGVHPRTGVSWRYQLDLDIPRED